MTDDGLDFGPLAESFENFQLIDSGGWGHIYSATQKQLGRKVAIKVLHDQLLLDPGNIPRFRQEAGVLTKLSHANIATIFDFGVLPAGQPYIVMEFIAGKNLSVLLKSQKFLPWRVCAEIAAQIAAGLAAAHQTGIVHRDIKPGNIIVLDSNDDGDVPHVKLIDFGLARRHDATESKGLTRSGELIGTPEYMSPEQCQGLPPDQRSDLYALGCLLYEMLTGINPFAAPTLYQCMSAHLNKRLSKVSQTTQKIPVDLDKLVVALLEKDAHLRPVSAHAVKERLYEILRSQRVNYGRRWAPVAVPVAAIMIALIGAGSMWFANHEAPAPRPRQTAISSITSEASAVTPADQSADDSIAGDPILMRKRILVAPGAPGSIPNANFYRAGLLPEDELQNQVSDIRECIKQLRTNGEGEQAQAMSGELKQYEDVYANFQPANSSKPELYFVSVNQPAKGSHVVKVKVTRKGVPVVLALAAGPEVVFQVDTAPGVKLQKVVIDEDKTVQGLAPNVAVRKVHFNPEGMIGCTTGDAIWYTRDRNLLRRITGLDVCTRQGMDIWEGHPIIVGPEDNQWRASFIVSRMSGFYEQCMAPNRRQIEAAISKLAPVKALYHPPASSHSQLMDINLHGQAATAGLGMDHQWRQIAIDGDKNVAFAVDNRWGATQLSQIDLKTGGATEISVPDNLPDATRIGAIAMDTTHHQLYVASASDFSPEVLARMSPEDRQSPFYRFDYTNKEWHRLPDQSLVVLAYHPQDNCLYGVEYHTFGNGRTLCKLSLTGERLREVPLSEPLVFPPGVLPSCQMSCDDGYLVVLCGFDGLASDLSNSNSYYVLNPHNGRVLQQGTFGQITVANK